MRFLELCLLKPHIHFSYCQKYDSCMNTTRKKGLYNILLFSYYYKNCDNNWQEGNGSPPV